MVSDSGIRCCWRCSFFTTEVPRPTPDAEDGSNGGSAASPSSSTVPFLYFDEMGWLSSAICVPEPEPEPDAAAAAAGGGDGDNDAGALSSLLSSWSIWRRMFPKAVSTASAQLTYSVCSIGSFADHQNRGARGGGGRGAGEKVGSVMKNKINRKISSSRATGAQHSTTVRINHTPTLTSATNFTSSATLMKASIPRELLFNPSNYHV